MEGKVSEKNLLEAEERPSDRYDNNRDAPQRNEETSINNTLDFTSLSLSLNNSEQDHKNQEQPLTQAGLLRIKLEEAKKENQNLRAMLNQITESYTALQNHLLLAMQKQQQSSQPRNYYDLQKLNRQDVIEKPVLPTWKFLDIGWPSPSEGFASARFNEKNMGSKLSSACMVEGDYINNQITPEGAKSIADQASEASGRKARVSIRARSDFSLMGDGCQWRKYGQKTAKGNPCPRAYYRCSMGTACPVRKQVQRCAKDNTVLITTYEGNHNHPLPPAARSMASTTSAALNMFLSGSTTSTTAHGSTLPNLGLFPSLSGSVSTGLASFSPSASCPTITLDLTLPSNNSLQFQRATSLNHSQPFPLPLHGCSRQSEGLNLYSKSPTVITPENNLLLADLVGEAIAKDPSFKAAFVAAISSFTGATQSLNSHNQDSKSGHEPSSNMPALLNQSCTTGLI